MTIVFKRAVCVAVLMSICAAAAVGADDCRRVKNILILFDASGYMKERDRYSELLAQISNFEKAIPVTADGFFHVGLRHYGYKVGMGCDSSESILSVQSWDPERLVHAFPKTVSYGTSALSAGLRGAADDVAALDGKTIILVIGAGIESCKTDPIQIAEQICRNNPDLEIHTFQVGNQPEGAHFLKGIAAKGHGAYSSSDSTGSPAGWHAWMKKYLVQPCAARPTAPGRETSAAVGMITFDNNSFSVRSKEPSADAANLASLQAAANAMRGNPAARLALHGFSDGKGSAEQNLKLSRKRAEAAAQFLISSYGLPPNRISIVAHGPSAPGAPRPQGPSERMGRRVEFEIIQ